MKRAILFILLFQFTNHIYGQDIIVLKNGDELKAIILEVLPDLIKYKKSDNENGPTYSENKGNVFMIKYKNGTKDVFNLQTPVTSTPIIINPQEEKKENAIKKLESYFVNYFRTANPNVFSLQSFKKTNGVLRDYFGQSVYEVDFELTVQFLVDAWKVGDNMRGYWGNKFSVYLSKPTSGLYMDEVKYFPRGTVLTLGCKSSLANSDNGYELKDYDIKTISNFGVKQLASPGSEVSNSNTNNQSTIDNKPVDFSKYSGYLTTNKGNYYIKVNSVNVIDELNNLSEIKSIFLTNLFSLKSISQPSTIVSDTLMVNASINLTYRNYSTNTFVAYFADCIFDYSLTSIHSGQTVFQNNYKKTNYSLLAKGFNSKIDAERALINSELKQTFNQFIIGNFPITADITEIVEKNRKQDEAKIVKINVGRNKGVFVGFEFVIPELNKNEKNGDISVTEVFEDYSICKVKNFEKEILERNKSGGKISVKTKYKATYD